MRNFDAQFFSPAIRSVYLKEEGFDLVSVYPTMTTSSLKFCQSDNKNETIWAVIVMNQVQF